MVRKTNKRTKAAKVARTIKRKANSEVAGASKMSGQNAATNTTDARDIPLNKLVASKSNVRRFYSTASIAALADSIASHELLQNLVVKAERGEQDALTGKFEVAAGGRRFAALTLLAKNKKIAKDALIPCNIREDGIAQELSLAENFAREALHPADEFEAFHDLHVTKGLSAAEIAARFGITERHVKERLKLAGVSSTLIALYRGEEMSLEQLMAFTVSDDPARQEEVWHGLTWNKEPGHIRDMLLESHVPATDKRVLFVGLDAYEAAGGTIVRDLFSQDDDFYLADPSLLDRLAVDKLGQAAEAVRAEGWQWVEIGLNFPHGHGYGRVYAREVALAKADARKVAKLETQIEECEQALDEQEDETGEAKLAGLQADLAAYDAKRYVFDPEQIAQSGAFVVIGHDGAAEVLRGLIRPEDKANPRDRAVAASDGAPAAATAKVAGLSDRLTADLTAHRTMALRDALASNPDMALTALVHSLVLQRFYSGASGETCLHVGARCTALSPLADNIEESVAGRSIAAREEEWARKLPQEATGAWDFVAALSTEDRLALLAHCVASSVDAVARSGDDPSVPAADHLAEALSLDMTRYWEASAASYFSRVSKAKIMEALSDFGMPGAAGRIDKGKKADMANAAERLLAGKGWLPEILRTTRKAPPADNFAQAAE